jgi:cytoskeletal protein CcmA (bactofilin family)
MASTKEFGMSNVDSTVVGQSILISGKLTGDEDLTVQGRVEGEITLTRTLIVEQSGIVKANVSVKNAIISGVVVGNISASESVELTREGRMVGDIRSPRVIIVDGASFRGHVDMGNAEPRGADERQAPRAVTRPVVRNTSVSSSSTPTKTQVQAVSRAPTPVAAPVRPAVVAKPLPPPRPMLVAKPMGSIAPGAPRMDKPALPAPPQPVLVGEAGKKKILLKKKK